MNTAWAISHGVLSCAYAPRNQYSLPYMAPLYPLLSSAAAFLTRIGSGAPFPSSVDLGPHCSTAIHAMYEWSVRSGAIGPTLRIGYLGWLVLAAGVVIFLRSSGRGRCAWEPLTLMLLAVAPPVFMCLQEYFHPEDLVALGLALGGLACVQRGKWVWAGVLLGLAVTSQQYAVLIAAALLVVAPRNQKFRFVVAAIGSAAIVVIPLVVYDKTSALHAAAVGSGSVATYANTLVDELHLSGPWLFLVSRILPIAVAIVIAWLAEQMLGSAVLEPVPLLSLCAMVLCLRLIFEVGLFGYKFMAVTVVLGLLDVMRGRVRAVLVVWVVLIGVAFHPFTWGLDSLRSSSAFWFPLWLWQLVLVPIVIYLAAGPFLSFAKQRLEAEPATVQ